MNRLEHYTSFGLEIVEYELDALARERMVTEVITAITTQSLDLQIPTLIALIRDNEGQSDQIITYVQGLLQACYDKVQKAVDAAHAEWQSKRNHDDHRVGKLLLAVENKAVSLVEALLYCGETDSLLTVIRPLATDRDELLAMLLYTELV